MELFEFINSEDDMALYDGDTEFFKFVKAEDIDKVKFTGVNVHFFDDKTQEYVIMKIPENDDERERFFYILENHERKKDLDLYMMLLNKMKESNYQEQTFKIFEK